MLVYDKFQYIYPPRPEFKIPPGELDKYDAGEYLAQPKYNGSCCLTFTNGSDLHIYNRHKQLLSNPSPDINFRGLALTKKWFVYAGEYLNKGKIGENGEKEKDKFVIWDVLVWDGAYQVGETLTDRLKMLEHIYPCQRARIKDNKLEMYKHLCCTKYNGVYKAPTYKGNFTELYNDLVKTDLYEGLVLKKVNSTLSYGFQPMNNTDWQVKARKETKLYHF